MAVARRRSRRGLAPSPCGAGGMAVARRRSRRGLAPSPCGAGGMAPPLPLRRGGQAPCAPMASVRQWPHRRVWVSCCERNHLDGHACEHPQRARDPWPEASTSAKSGSLRTEYSRVPPGRAVVVEAERSRVERGRPRDGGPARSGGCGGTSIDPPKSAFERQTSGPARLLAPSPCGAGGMAPPLPLRRRGQAPDAPMASVRQWPHRRAWVSCCECAQASFFTASTTLSATQWRWASVISP
jgi:hypothetical protein